jgi:hypothetical protein
VDSLFQVLKTNDKFMEVLQYRKTGKSFTRMPSGRTIWQIIKRQLLARNIGSISKMFTSVLIFKAIEKKKLSLNQTIESYFPSVEMRIKLP